MAFKIHYSCKGRDCFVNVNCCVPHWDSLFWVIDWAWWKLTICGGEDYLFIIQTLVVKIIKESLWHNNDSGASYSWTNRIKPHLWLSFHHSNFVFMEDSCWTCWWKSCQWLGNCYKLFLSTFRYFALYNSHQQGVTAATVLSTPSKQTIIIIKMC